MVWRRVVSTVLGVVLIILGLVGYHVEVAAIAAGAILLGLVSLESVLQAVDTRRQPRDDASP